MGTITVTPEEFTFVKFDHAALVDILTKLRDLLGVGASGIDLVVQEKVPFGKATVTSIDPIGLDVESGALEDPRKPRELSIPGSASILGQLLLRARDLRSEAFGGPPVGVPLSEPVNVAWSTYSVARLSRALAAAGDPIGGFRPQVQRRRYTFRTRHGFSDVADEQFEQLWNADDLTFGDIVAISGRALAEAAA